jgi:hypothetical protein
MQKKAKKPNRKIQKKIKAEKTRGKKAESTKCQKEHKNTGQK